MSKLQTELELQKQQTKQEVPRIAGLLGIPLSGQKRIEVPGRNAYVFVRLRSNQSEVIQAYNNKVASAYNLPVLVERDGNRYVVVSVDTKRYENNWNSQSSFLPRHGNVHSFDTESGGGGDIVWVYPRQITPILVMPSGSSGAGNVVVNPYTLKNNDGTWKYIGNTGTASITQYNPTSPTGAIMALVYLDAPSGNPYLFINSGTVFSNTITGSNQLAPYIPAITNQATQIPLAAIRLITGTSRVSWDNIYDVRQFLHTIPTGSGGGGGLSSIPVYNTGSSVGNATALDFQHPLFVGFTGSTAYPSIDGTLLATEDVTNQFISGSAVNHFTLTGTVELGTDRLYYNGLRQQRTTHYTVDANGRGFNTLFTGTYGDVLIMEYGNLGVQASLPATSSSNLGMYGIRSLIGNNAGATGDQFSISAYQVLLWNPTNNDTVLRIATGTLTCDKSISGSAANGRDQMNAFSNDSFVHLYYIWNGTTLATLFSASAPPNLPTLPSGYTHLCYTCSIKINSSGDFEQVKLRGRKIYYTDEKTILSAGSSTTGSSVSPSAYVPSVAVNFDAFIEGVTVTSSSTLIIGTETSGTVLYSTNIPGDTRQYFTLNFPNMDMFYYWSGGATHQVWITVTAYEVPNGAT